MIAPTGPMPSSQPGETPPGAHIRPWQARRSGPMLTVP
jgi:hypothetical protein